MDDKTKKVLLVIGAAVAIAVAIFVVINTVSTPDVGKEEIVGTLPMPEGGGRDAEAGAQSPVIPADPAAPADPSGMPAEVLQGG